jgi:hypothetical protein
MVMHVDDDLIDHADQRVERPPEQGAATDRAQHLRALQRQRPQPPARPGGQRHPDQIGPGSTCNTVAHVSTPLVQRQIATFALLDAFFRSSTFWAAEGLGGSPQILLAASVAAYARGSLANEEQRLSCRRRRRSRRSSCVYLSFQWCPELGFTGSQLLSLRP